MDISKLEIMLKVIENGNMTKTSEDINYTQSGISHIVKAMEKELGFPLLVRNRVGVEATEECKRVLPMMEKIVYWHEQLLETSAAIKGITIGKVRIGTFTSMSVNLLPKIIKNYQTKYPNVEIELVESGDQALAEGLDNGTIDIGFGRKQDGLKADWIPMIEDYLMAVLPVDSYKGDCFPLQQFHQKPFIALPDCFDQEVREVFEQFGIIPEIKFLSRDDYTIIAMVEEGLGISILPKMVLQGYKHCHIQTVPLDPIQTRHLGIVLPSLDSASPAVLKFIDCAKEVMQR